MYLINDAFQMEENYLIGGILLGVVVLICGACFFLARFAQKKMFNLIGGIASVVMMISATLFCYNFLVVAAYWIAVVALTYFLTAICTEYHKTTIYSVPFLTLFFRMFFPIATAGMLFRPWFSNEADGWNRIMPGIGLNISGTYVYDVAVLNEAKTATVWNIISIIEILLFLAVFVMQILLVWREFADPDNAVNWATIGMIVTCIGIMFIYGVYTSPNFLIATTMEKSQKLDFATGQFVTAFKPVKSSVESITMAPVVAFLFALASRAFYIEFRKKKKN